MKTLYLDIFSGISGDMFIGALLDLGVESARLEGELKKLNLTGYHLHVGRGKKAGIDGVKFDVHLAHDDAHDDHHHHHDHGHEQHADGHSHSHAPEHQAAQGSHGGPIIKISRGEVELSVFETSVPPRFRLYFRNQAGKPAAPLAANTVSLETIRPGGKRQVFKFKAGKGYLEATEKLSEPHEFTAILKVKQGKRTEKQKFEFFEVHEHD